MWLETMDHTDHVVTLDRKAGHREFVDVNTDGSPVGVSYFAFTSVSDDGNRVGFFPDLDVFVRDRAGGTTQDVSLPVAPGGALVANFGGWISGDGSIVAVDSAFDGYTTPDGRGPVADVYVRQLDG
jgi:hypothetical protein